MKRYSGFKWLCIRSMSSQKVWLSDQFPSTLGGRQVFQHSIRLAQAPDLRNLRVLPNVAERLSSNAPFDVQILKVVRHDYPVRVEVHPIGVGLAGVGVVADDGVVEGVGAVHA